MSFAYFSASKSMSPKAGQSKKITRLALHAVPTGISSETGQNKKYLPELFCHPVPTREQSLIAMQLIGFQNRANQAATFNI